MPVSPSTMPHSLINPAVEPYPLLFSRSQSSSRPPLKSACSGAQSPSTSHPGASSSLAASVGAFFSLFWSPTSWIMLTGGFPLHNSPPHVVNHLGANSDASNLPIGLVVSHSTSPYPHFCEWCSRAPYRQALDHTIDGTATGPLSRCVSPPPFHTPLDSQGHSLHFGVFGWV